MNKIIRYGAVALVCLSVLSIYTACDKNTTAPDIESENYFGLPEYDAEKMDDYIKPFEYTGLTVYAQGMETRQEALWRTLSDSVEVLSYPQEQVEYYAAQERAKYRYYADRDGIEYEKLLEGLGVTEEGIYGRARELVKDDLVFEYIVLNADIRLSEEEKLTHLDRYAEKLTEVYGYDKEYIKSNMIEQVYDAMLYDKTMEYLLLNNTVHTTMSK